MSSSSSDFLTGGMDVALVRGSGTDGFGSCEGEEMMREKMPLALGNGSTSRIGSGAGAWTGSFSCAGAEAAGAPNPGGIGLFGTRGCCIGTRANGSFENEDRSGDDLGT